MTSCLPRPGSIVQIDCRGASQQHRPTDKPIKVLQWNIERGYQLPAIIAELQREQADVIALQEIDVGCQRSGGRDTGLEIAKGLGLNYCFFCEFAEHRSALRSPRSQGGGVHGNGILTRFDMSGARLVKHRMHPVDWNTTEPTEDFQKHEPREGERAVLAATVHCPAGDLLVYCLHMEVFCGMLARLEQFADVLRDSREQIAEGQERQCILGDLNTMAHGIARLSPRFCRDSMRWRSLGQTEAGYWQRNLFDVPDPRHPGRAQPAGCSTAGAPTDGLLLNIRLQQAGVPEAACAELLNPGFFDPFPPSTVTLDNPAWRFGPLHLMAGKLDWMLLRGGIQPVRTSIGNHSFAASDHKWLASEVHFT